VLIKKEEKGQMEMTRDKKSPGIGVYRNEDVQEKPETKKVVSLSNYRESKQKSPGIDMEKKKKIASKKEWNPAHRISKRGRKSTQDLRKMGRRP